VSFSVLDLDAFERTKKAEGLGMASELGSGAGEKNMHDAEFTCKLFRFLQLLCEGHNLGEYTVIALAFFKISFYNNHETIAVAFLFTTWVSTQSLS
jgi:hypothetical protein